MLTKIYPDDVMFLCTEGNYTKIVMKDKTYCMVRASLSSALKKLPPGAFIKTHRSFAASVYYIDTIYKDYLQVGDESIPIAKQYYKPLLNQLDIIE